MKWKFTLRKHVHFVIRDIFIFCIALTSELDKTPNSAARLGIGIEKSTIDRLVDYRPEKADYRLSTFVFFKSLLSRALLPESFLISV